MESFTNHTFPHKISISAERAFRRSSILCFGLGALVAAGAGAKQVAVGRASALGLRPFESGIVSDRKCACGKVDSGGNFRGNRFMRKISPTS